MVCFSTIVEPRPIVFLRDGVFCEFFHSGVMSELIPGFMLFRTNLMLTMWKSVCKCGQNKVTEEPVTAAATAAATSRSLNTSVKLQKTLVFCTGLALGNTLENEKNDEEF